MRTIITSLAGLTLAVGVVPASAEIIEAEDDHFVSRTEAVVEADRTATWLALISPARWWSSEHTWSADAANLTLTPQAGGCFCEKIPEVDEPGRFTLEGSVEHMRVLQSYPETALRMQGGLGPLQSEPVIGILTIALSETEEGTRIVWEYNVGGKMRYQQDVIAPAVDGVMTLQLTRLAELLGTVAAPVARSGASAPEQVPDTEPEPDAEMAGEEVIDEGSAAPSVDDAFGDLSSDG